MPQTISLLTVLLGILGFLFIKVAVLHLLARGETSLGWLTGALVFILAQLIVFTQIGPARVELAAALIGMPGAFYCVSQSIRIMTGQRVRYRRFWRAMGFATALVGVALVAGAPLFFIAIAIKLLAAAGAGCAMLRLVRARRRSLLDWPLAALMSALVLLPLSRAFLLLTTLNPAADYDAVLAGAGEAGFLTTLSFVGVAAILLLVYRGFAELVGELQTRSSRDALTGLYNRDAFVRLARRHRRKGGALLFADLDRFKDVNDTRGHAAGDQTLRAFADILSETDYLAGRVGGDEFALLMPGSDEAEAAMIGRQIFEALDRVNRSGKAIPPISVSMGIAEYRRGEGLFGVLERADRAQYDAKRSGGGRMSVHSKDARQAPPEPLAVTG